MTFFNGPQTGTVRWSPDSRHLVFDSRATGHPHLYVLRFVNASCIVLGRQNRGGARIANHCDAGARERFLKNSLFLLPSGSRGKETVRCDAGLSSSVHSPWGDLVPDVCSFVTFPENVGWKRACVTASKPEASVMSVGSLKAVPMKLIPIGIPSTSAAGTLMIG